jgi:hypothetical protein
MEKLPEGIGGRFLEGLPPRGASVLALQRHETRLAMRFESATSHCDYPSAPPTNSQFRDAKSFGRSLTCSRDSCIRTRTETGTHSLEGVLHRFLPLLLPWAEKRVSRPHVIVALPLSKGSSACSSSSAHLPPFSACIYAELDEIDLCLTMKLDIIPSDPETPRS